MKRNLLYVSVLLSVVACNSPTKQHDKQMDKKANKLQNITSGPLAKSDTASVNEIDTTAALKH